ncbi:hypothetical protein SODALDRAFT_333533 [Sodiomyces alkalinus F11]|uniref:Conidiation-specific protein 13 n=1 Tax=Sodiomyces alkalinus (strain CBS 110278 / VKM F-3762 / F11) TaxID=1314773 RepID=A0A3N2PTF3_SODAK|nr:hypothetical protein SODALDRAFT_333533 [Sodiomyces alkalinus F11]ROT37780.1 hypothetical protein SODALDRAFT_333533 [Sodiomyces alkalinus F11]
MFRTGLTCLVALTDLFGEYSLGRRQTIPAPDPNVDEVFDGDDGLYALDDLGLSDLPQAQWTSTRWAEGELPEACYLYTLERDLLGGSCRPSEMQVYSVTYEDCEDPWIICRCGDATGDARTMIRHLGQLPVQSREYVRYVMMTADRDNTAALSIYWEGDLIVFGQSSSVSLFVHEVAHNVDWWEFGRNGLAYSDLSEWHDAVDNETCVAAEYAKTTYGEAYAETAVMVAYDVNVEPISEIVDYSCMEGTFNIVKEQMGEMLRYDEGKTCGSRIRHDERVCVRGRDMVAACPDSGNGNGVGEDHDSSSGSESVSGSAPGQGTVTESVMVTATSTSTATETETATGSGAVESIPVGDSSARPGVSLGKIPFFVFRSVARVTNFLGGRRA